MLEEFGRFLTQTGTSDGTVSETKRKTRESDLKLAQKRDNNGGDDLAAGRSTETPHVYSRKNEGDHRESKQRRNRTTS